MDFIIEFLLELILEGSIEVSSNKKIPKWIRYPLIGIIILFFIVVIFSVFILGLLLFKENIFISFIIILISIVLLVGAIYKFRKIYLEEFKKGNNQ